MQVDEEGKAEEEAPAVPPPAFRVLYFPIDDGREESNTVYAQFEVNASREYFDSLDAEKIEEAARNQRTSTGQYLMIFNDESYSMRGSPFEAVRKSGEIIADQIFGEEGKPEDNMF